MTTSPNPDVMLANFGNKKIDLPTLIAGLKAIPWEGGLEPQPTDANSAYMSRMDAVPTPGHRLTASLCHAMQEGHITEHHADRITKALQG